MDQADDNIKPGEPLVDIFFTKDEVKTIIAAMGGYHRRILLSKDGDSLQVTAASRSVLSKLVHVMPTVIPGDAGDAVAKQLRALLLAEGTV